MMEDNIKDVKFEEVNEENNEKQKNIRGKAIYFSTSQVANMLGQPDSKIRYYTTVFDEILNIEISNKQRRYTENDIEKLKFIIELKDEGMTLKQIQEYCQNVDFDKEKGIQIKESNPLTIQTLAKALLEEQNKQLIEFKENLITEIENKLNTQLEVINIKNTEIGEKIREDIAITVDTVMSEKLEESSKEIKDHINESTEKSAQMQQENKKILEEVVFTVNEIKETDKRLKELLDDPEAFKKALKSIKKENDGFLNRIKNKFK